MSAGESGETVGPSLADRAELPDRLGVAGVPVKLGEHHGANFWVGRRGDGPSGGGVGDVQGGVVESCAAQPFAASTPRQTRGQAVGLAMSMLSVGVLVGQDDGRTGKPPTTAAAGTVANGTPPAVWRS